jgi:hypothetical protein
MATQSAKDLHDGHAWAAANPAVFAFAAGGRKPSGIAYCFDTLLQNHSHTLFIKIDDDIVFMRAGALAYLAAHKLFHRLHKFRLHGIVSANVVNHGHLAYGVSPLTTLCHCCSPACLTLSNGNRVCRSPCRSRFVAAGQAHRMVQLLCSARYGA